MNIPERLRAWLATLLGGLDWFKDIGWLQRLLAQRQAQAVAAGVGHAKAAVTPVAQRAAAWHPIPTLRRFDPAASRHLTEFELVGANMLFEGLGVAWIPPEYLEILEDTPDPLEAFHRFCNKYGLWIDQIKGRTGADELERFEATIYVLVELSSLGTAVTPDNRRAITQHMWGRQHQLAVEAVETIRIVLKVVEEITETAGQPIIIGMHRSFIATVMGNFTGDPLAVSREDAGDARELRTQLLTLEEYLVELLAYINDQVTFLQKDWPTSSDDKDFEQWLADNQNLPEGMGVRASEIAAQIAENEGLSIQEVIDLLEQLQEVATHLNTLTRKLVENANVTWGGGAEPQQTSAEAVPSAWRSAAQTLELYGQSAWDKSTVKRHYVKTALAHHPDRHQSKDEAVQEMHAELFKKFTEVRNYLLRHLDEGTAPSPPFNIDPPTA